MNDTHANQELIAVIGFSDRASPLEPLWPSTHRALVPIAGKPLIIHLIEQLAEAGIRHVRIAGSIQQYAVRKRLRDGCEWGVTVRYSDLHGDDLRMECLASSGECLFLLGDELQYANFAVLARRQRQQQLLADANAGAGLWQLHNGEQRGYSLRTTCGQCTYINELASAHDYHLANIRAAQGLLPMLNIPGSKIHRHAVADWNCRVASNAYIGKSVFIGKHSKVGKLARLEEDCVLSNGVIVSNGTRLRNVSVLPNCFVGRNASIRDAILGPTGYLGFDGRFTPVENPSVVGETRESQEQLTGIPSTRFAEAWSVS